MAMSKRFRFIKPDGGAKSARQELLMKQLGRPSHSHGFLGALADLADPFSPYEEPRSSMRLVREQNLRRLQESRERIEALARDLSAK